MYNWKQNKGYPKNTVTPLENTALLNTIEWALDYYPSNWS
jgi:hypothetical protein